MIHEKIFLREGEEDITLTTYIADERRALRDAILVIPGGGYTQVCADREGEPIALAFMARGLNAFVLHYGVKEKARYPRALADASLAMQYIREHAEEYGIDPERVFVCGFSAGAHLSASLGTRWHTKEVNEALDIPFGINRPTGMLLCYPVLCYFPETHQGTFTNAFGTDTPTEEQIDFCSLDRGLSKETVPPAFFWQTSDDPAVNVKNTLRMTTALSEAGVPFEVHIYPHGPHGMALATEATAPKPMWKNERIAGWVDLAYSWLKTI